MWNGWGDLHPQGAALLTFAGPDATPAERAAVQAAAETRHQALHAAAVDPAVAKAVRSYNGRPGPSLLQLPRRAYVLLEASLDELADPAWPRSAGIGWVPDLPGPMPQLIWPDDRAWCLGCEVDDATTIIGGSSALVAVVCATPDVDALPVGPDDRLGSVGDGNR